LLNPTKWLLLFPPTALRPPQKRLQHFCGGSQRGKKPPFRGFFIFLTKQGDYIKKNRLLCKLQERK
jgi:hypothetical protein